ncbi:hypothetical protein EI94DRAFT_1707744 [Lactarius quietus]|nr:hypothetical protein EI94DRAFT_1707744 [Lactarius quietus]
MVHYVHLLQEFGAPTWLCSSIMESCHISAVKDPWWHSNCDEPIRQMVLTNQRLDKLAFACACFIVCRMLLEDQTTTSNHKPARSNKEDDGAVDGEIMGEVTLAIRPFLYQRKLISEPPEPGYPADLTSLAECLNTPDLP